MKNFPTQCIIYASEVRRMKNDRHDDEAEYRRTKRKQNLRTHVCGGLFLF